MNDKIVQAVLWPKHKLSEISCQLSTGYQIKKRNKDKRKRQTTAGRDERPTKGQALRPLKPYSRYLITLKILFCVCLAHARQSSAPEAAHGVALTDSIKPLQIGDTIPDELWNSPLKMVKAGEEGSTTITLKEYKGKLIILDFWATWCGPCITEMPHLFNLQDEMSDVIQVLPVTKESIEHLTKWLPGNKLLKLRAGQVMYSLTDGKKLGAYFPHRVIPHTIVINKEGRVEAITVPNQLNAHVLSRLMSKEQSYSVPKKRELSLDKPMLERAYRESENYGPLFYTAITGYNDGTLFMANELRDEEMGYYRTYVTTSSVLQLYNRVLDTPGLALFHNRRMLELKEPAKADSLLNSYGFRNVEDIDWIRQHTYNYEAVLPIGTTKEKQLERMKADLDLYFGLGGRVEKREVKCLVMELGDAFKSVREAEEIGGVERFNPMKHLGLDEPTEVRTSIAALLYHLNRGELGAVPPVFDATGWKGNIPIKLPAKLRDFYQLQAALAEAGILFREEERDISMFVLTEDGVETDNLVFELSDYGYISKSEEQ